MHPPRGPVAAAIPAAGGVADALEHLGDGERLALRVRDLHHLSQTAAELARAAGVGEVFLPPEDERRDRLGDLDRRAADARGEGGRGEAVLAGAGARAPGVEGVHDEVLAPVGVLVRETGTGHDDRVPKAGRPLGGHRAGAHRLFETPQDDIREHLPDRVARGDGGGRRRVQQRTRRGGDLDRGQRSGVVGNLGAHHAADAERTVGTRIGDRDVDPARRHGRGAVPVEPDPVGPHGEGADEIEVPVVAVDAHPVPVRAGPEGADPLQHRAL